MSCTTTQAIPGSFAGVPPATLQTWLTDAQLARHNLMTGALPSVVSYGNGDGTKSVTYTRANLGALDAYIQSLLRALGLGRRRAVGVLFT
jgi:hypothetical protein